MQHSKLYLWQGVDVDRNLQHGEMTAKSLVQARAQLLSKGILPFRLKYQCRFKKKRYHRQALTTITKQLATMLTAGLPLLNSLQLICREHPHIEWRYLMSQLIALLLQGQTLAFALERYPLIFPKLYCQVVASAELTGKLDHCFNFLAKQLEDQQQLHTKIMQSFRYPLFILTITILITLVMLVFVLPRFAEIYQSFSAPLPPFTQQLINLSKQSHWGLIILLSLFFITQIVKHSKLSHSYYYHYLYSRLPVVRNYILTLIFQTLAITLQAGVPLIAALQSAEKVIINLAYRQALQQISRQLQQGSSLSESVGESRLFPPLCQQLISVGEETGDLEQVFYQLATTCQQQTADQLSHLTQKIEPILMLSLGLIIAGLVIALYLPIFQLGQVIQ